MKKSLTRKRVQISLPTCSLLLFWLCLCDEELKRKKKKITQERTWVIFENIIFSPEGPCHPVCPYLDALLPVLVSGPAFAILPLHTQ